MIKKSLFFLLAFICLTVKAQTTYVLSMGVQNYNNPDNQHNPLFNSAKDAMEVDSIFKKSGAKTACLTGKFVNVENINEKMKRIKHKVNKNPGKDNVVIFFSMHGSASGHLATWDGILYLGDFIEQMADMKAKNIFMFLNDCHSGSAGQIFLDMPKEKRNPNLFIFSACRIDETAIDENLLGSAWFSAALIKGLRGASDKNKDRGITVAELHQYIYDDVVLRCERQNQVAEEGATTYNMHPQLYGPKSKMDEVVISYKMK